MITFPLSTRYQAWYQSLRAKFIKGPLLEGIARALGDQTVDDLTQANLESLAQFANDPKSIGLIAVERQIDRGPFESDDDFRLRLTYAVPMWRLAGTPLGMLLALYYAGWPNAVITQINGRGFYLSGTPNLDDVVTLLSTGATPSWFAAVDLSATGEPYTGDVTIPAGQPWLAFDFDNDFTSRFQVLLPDPLPSFMRTWATVSFVNTDTAQAAWNLPMESTSYTVQVGGVQAPGGVLVNVDGSTKTLVDVTLRASGSFTGTVDVLAYPSGANPFCWLRSYDLARLQATIRKWKPAKATCLGAYAQCMGNYWGWPVRKFGSGELFQAAHIERFAP